jgi:hypothetical protein
MLGFTRIVFSRLHLSFNPLAPNLNSGAICKTLDLNYRIYFFITTPPPPQSWGWGRATRLYKDVLNWLTRMFCCSGIEPSSLWQCICCLVPKVNYFCHIHILINASSGGSETFLKSVSYCKIQGAGRMMRIQFHTEDPQILGAAMQCL